MKEGKMIGQGGPEEILTEELLEEIMAQTAGFYCGEKAVYIGGVDKNRKCKKDVDI